MIKLEYNTIISLLSRKIKDNYPDCKIYKDKKLQGLKRPCFFIFNLNTEQNKENFLINNRDIFINIRYLTDEGREGLDKVGFELISLVEKLEIEGFNLRPKKINYEIQEDAMQMFISYSLRVYEELEEEIKMNKFKVEEL
ncbi:MAG: phage tail terminator family protein [Clostridium sp.]